MQPLLKDSLLYGQWLRAAGHAAAGGADLGECLAISEAIRERDPESWRGAWSRFAERLARDAEADTARGRLQSAHEGFLRASNYFRASALFDLQPGAEDRLKASYRRQREAFQAALAARPGLGEAIGIPFEGVELPGYIFKSPGDSPKPTLIITGGYDSTAEELYFYSAPWALARGFNVVCYDGPGQGGALAELGLTFRPDWETVFAAVMRVVTDWTEVDSAKIVLMGLSFGGLLAPRAATGGASLAALIADPGQYSLREEMLTRLPRALAAGVDSGGLRAAILDRILSTRLKSPTGGWALRRGLLTHGVETPLDYLRTTAEFTLEGRIDSIRCPTLIANAEGDAIGATGRKLYDLLQCPKTFQPFLVAEGAGAHCESGARALFNRRAFNWLDSQIVQW